MSGIPIYSHSQITPAPTAMPKATETNTAPSATTASKTTSYPAAQPGMAPVPGPTSISSQRYTPSQLTAMATPTSSAARQEGPPKPQPGAVPRAVPQTGAALAATPTAAATLMIPPYPPQMSVPPPTTAYEGQTSARGTSSYVTRTVAGGPHDPVGLPPASSSGAGANVPRQGPDGQHLEHPPGYQQDVHAWEPSNSATGAQAGPGVFGTQDDDDSEGIWERAKWLAQTAGQKLSNAEMEVWRMINKE